MFWSSLKPFGIDSLNRRKFKDEEPKFSCDENPKRLMEKNNGNFLYPLEFQTFISRGFGERNGDILFGVEGFALIGHFRGLKRLNNRK